MSKFVNNVNKNKNSFKKGSRVVQSSDQKMTISVPAAYSYKATSQRPKFEQSREGIRIRRSEFVGTATNYGVTGFGLTIASAAMPGYDLNPSCPILFPWLSRLATNFERYRFESVKFRFVPSQSTATAGRFYAAVDYDYDDAPATTKTTLMGNHTAIESPVWQECTLTCDPACLNRDLPYRYVNCTTRGLSVEQRTAYAGFLMLAFDTSVANLLMDIWVEYDVSLVTPVTDEMITQDVVADTTAWTPVANLTIAQGTTFAGNPMKSNQGTASGPIRVVTPGNAGVPNLSSTIGGGAFSHTTAVDISDAKGLGVLDLLTMFNVTGLSPATLMSAANTVNTIYSCFDSFGVFQYFLSSFSALHSLIGPKTYNLLDTATHPVLTSHVIDLHDIVSTNPQVRYIAPAITSLQALGAGNSVAGFHWSS